LLLRIIPLLPDRRRKGKGGDHAVKEVKSEAQLAEGGGGFGAAERIGRVIELTHRLFCCSWSFRR
jgi:hypothetical protein